MEPKRKQHPAVDVTGDVKSDAAKNNIAKEPGMLGPWIKQGKLEVVKQEMARVNISF